MRNQRSSMASGNSNRNRNIILAVLAVIAVAVVVYFLVGGRDSEKAPFVDDWDWDAGEVPKERPGARPGTEPGEDGGRGQSRDDSDVVVPQLVEEDEEESEGDAWVRGELEDLFGRQRLDRFSPKSNALPRLIAVAASVSEGTIIARQVRFWRPEGNFPVVHHAGGLIYMDRAGYRRFAPLVDTLVSVDPQSLINLFNRSEPILQTAYRQLGYRRGNVRTVLRSAIDRVLDAPIRTGRIALVRTTVQYHYADGSLEKLDPVSKQMIRMGPENTRKLQSWLKRLRPSL